MRQKGMERIALAWLILSGRVIQWFADGIINQLTYSGTELLALRDGAALPSAGLLNDVPRELCRHHGAGHRRDGKARKRGKRGGVRQRTRRASKLPLPQMLLCNSRSLRNKLDELRLLARGCYEYHWDVFFKDADIDRATESTTAYISFCVDSIIPQKTVKIYPNNKPYITRDIKDCIRRKKSAFKLSDTEGVRTAQKELNQHMRAARLQYKERAERDLSMNNSKKLEQRVVHPALVDSGADEDLMDRQLAERLGLEIIPV
ncbi:hypothetical protein N1851_015429 [Merluccius polli]|uniref:Uncharacterized protein n=1 Tax=Merluccius polli TaxID=89951 RepID=A0AA47MS79_MERPO|nr:hypothetical protein N1851_015429 [Merluccius polli]